MNVLNVSDIERELAKASASAVHTPVSRWVTTVARNHILGKLGEKDVVSNFRVYNPAEKLDPLMPKPDSLPIWAKAALERGETIHWFDRAQPRRRVLWQTLDMIVLWFNTFEATDTRLKRVDRISFDIAAKAAAFWFKDLNENVWSYVKDKPPVVKEYDNGFCWVRLMTSLHFEREGRLMHHCVGGGYYFDLWRNGKAQYYSLRDKDNEPHITMEVHFTDSAGNKSHKGRMVQCKGNSNRRPAPMYQTYLRMFLKDMKFDVDGDRGNVDLE